MERNKVKKNEVGKRKNEEKVKQTERKKEKE